jgi:hypothetical protein
VLRQGRLQEAFVKRGYCNDLAHMTSAARLFDEPTNPLANFVSNLPEESKAVLVWACEHPGVLDRPVLAVRLTREDRTGSLRRIAHRDHKREVLPVVLRHMLRSLLRDVDSDFAHDADGIVVDVTGKYSSTVRLKAIWCQMTQPSLSHLAAA